MKRIVTFIMAVIMIAALANPSTVDAATNAKLSKKKVTLTITDKKKNPSVTLKVKGTSKKAAKKAKWKTYDKKVASVSKKGKVTAKKAGKAVITCKVGGKLLKCYVTVEDRTRECEYWQHKWKYHWASYDAEGTYNQGVPYDTNEGVGYAWDEESGLWVPYFLNTNPPAYWCNCGLFPSAEDEKASYPKYKSPRDLQHKLGLHSSNAKMTCDSGGDSTGLCWWKIHTDYPDYMDCTKCGMHVEAKDTPEKIRSSEYKIEKNAAGVYVWTHYTVLSKK